MYFNSSSMTYADKMNTRQFINFILAIFVAGTFLLVLMQYNSSGHMELALMVFSACAWLWLIIGRLRKQEQLIMQLDISEKKAKEAARIKENFMANMSHEIRTPLNAILGFTNLLKMRAMEHTSQEFVGSIQKAGENLLTIINDILDLSKIEAGMMRVENNPFSVRGLFLSIKTLFSEKIKEKRLEIKYEIDAQVPDTLIGDATRLTQILVNLIGNAIKFTEKGHVFIHIYNKQVNGAHMELGFSISDTGIGIEKNKIPGIFDRFHQAEDSTTRNYGGTGLGLSIVKDLLLLQHGHIEVDSDLGKGTTFRFFIPYLISSEQFTESVLTDDNTLKQYTSGEINLLIVDDNEMNQSLMKHLLNEWNLCYDIAGNGAGALELLKHHKYDMVLMDIQMPGMDGYSATHHMRTVLKLDVPIIAMTAHALAGEREKCLSFGMNEYLSKPISEQQLYTFITRFTGGNAKRIAGLNNEQVNAEIYSCIDLSYIKEVSKGNVLYEKNVTGQFLEMVPKALMEIDTALLTNDFVTISHVAHNLKTSISIMGMTGQLEDILDNLEYIYDEDTIREDAESLKVISGIALKEAADFYETL